MCLTINAVKYFTLGCVTSARETEGHSWNWAIFLIRKINPSCSSGRGPDWGRCPIPNRLLNTGYILSALSLLQQLQHVSARYLPTFSQLEFHPLHSPSLWSSTPIWYLCCVVTPAEKLLDFVQMMKKCAHLDYLKLITFLMESSHLAEILQLYFSGMWLHCKWLNIIHHKLRFKTSSNPPEQKKWACVPNYTHKYNSG